MSSVRFRHLLSELKKLTPRDRQFILSFVLGKTGNRSYDDNNFRFELETNNYHNPLRLQKVYNMMYDMNEVHVKKLAEKFGM